MIQEMKIPARHRSCGFSIRSFEQTAESSSYASLSHSTPTEDGRFCTLSSESNIGFSISRSLCLRFTSLNSEGKHCSSNFFNAASKK